MNIKGMPVHEVLERFMRGFERRNPGEQDFYQAVNELAQDIVPFMVAHERYARMNILERLTEPDRVISFRVNWVDDEGNVRTNRGYRVQHNNSIGPYKGGLRFHKGVTLDTLKFLAFEQTFKNSLTGLPMGGAKGGSDFNPKGKSEREVMMFCQAFMSQLYRYIGPNTDIPAGDIGVGGREISFLYGQYKRLTNELTPVMTGKNLAVGGSMIRPEATGYGAVYMAENMLATRGEDLSGKSAIVSGSGNVALFAAEKLLQKGAKVLTVSDSSGYVFDSDGINEHKLQWLMDLKFNRRGRLEEYASEFRHVEYGTGQKPWNVPTDMAFPCATQNEIDEVDARAIVANGCQLVAEGANMPTRKEGVRIFQKSGLLFAPGKAANAGGVAVSGLEISQNSMRMSWPQEEVDTRLQAIMRNIHAQMVKHGQDGQSVDYVKGANIGSFIKVADAMLALGVI